MSGEAAARVLHQRFEEIRQSELVRLRKKMASFGPALPEAEDIITQVVQAIAAAPERVLAAGAEPRLVDALVRLFRLPREGGGLAAEAD